ncbi:hypothetical protein FBU59_003714 [Linderina macrospora]|uniref:Uncharacterized protein n=1 Tax=Linderina macrospora TaxID=4868 RepID=A0ACC1J7R2_9FUNG|nr:hypothetical protein FBU59_003714 [Linderina macrospora]
MVRHSKNNTASGVFTYAERQMVDYGTKTKRLGIDSKRKFDACYLCLTTARTPMLCPRGHISCKECVLASILEQKQAIKRAQKEYDGFLAKEQMEAKDMEKRRKELEVQRHVEGEVGLSKKGKRTAGEVDEESEKPSAKKVKMIEAGPSAKEPAVDEASSGEGSVAKRPVFSLAGKGKQSDSAMDETSTKPKLASFWVPSLAPEAKHTPTDPATMSVQCHASTPTHPLKLKSLISVCFRESNGEKLCPSCDKSLKNSSKIDVLKPCGHAICHRCVSNFVLPAGKCFVCQAKVKPADAIRLGSEGTGFSGGGGQMIATRYDNALQA